MNIRTRVRRRLRRWRLGPTLYDHAVATIAIVEASDRQGRENAHAFLRANGLAHLIREPEDS